MVIRHGIRYPDKAIREKQIPWPYGFSSLVLHSDELLKNGVRLKLVLYEGLQICLLSGLLPPVFIGCSGLFINLPLPFNARGIGSSVEPEIQCPSQRRLETAPGGEVSCTLPKQIYSSQNPPKCHLSDYSWWVSIQRTKSQSPH